MKSAIHMGILFCCLTLLNLPSFPASKEQMPDSLNFIVNFVHLREDGVIRALNTLLGEQHFHFQIDTVWQKILAYKRQRNKNVELPLLGSQSVETNGSLNGITILKTKNAFVARLYVSTILSAEQKEKAIQLTTELLTDMVDTGTLTLATEEIELTGNSSNPGTSLAHTFPTLAPSTAWESWTTPPQVWIPLGTIGLIVGFLILMLVWTVSRLRYLKSLAHSLGGISTLLESSGGNLTPAASTNSYPFPGTQPPAATPSQTPVLENHTTDTLIAKLDDSVKTNAVSVGFALYHILSSEDPVPAAGIFYSRQTQDVARIISMLSLEHQLTLRWLKGQSAPSDLSRLLKDIHAIQSDIPSGTDKLDQSYALLLKKPVEEMARVITELSEDQQTALILNVPALWRDQVAKHLPDLAMDTVVIHWLTQSAEQKASAHRGAMTEMAKKLALSHQDTQDDQAILDTLSKIPPGTSKGRLLEFFEQKPTWYQLIRNYVLAPQDIFDLTPQSLQDLIAPLAWQDIAILGHGANDEHIELLLKACPTARVRALVGSQWKKISSLEETERTSATQKLNEAKTALFTRLIPDLRSKLRSGAYQWVQSIETDTSTSDESEDQAA